jgi:serine/threonine protein kinase
MVDQDNVVKLIDFGLVVPNTPDFQKPGNRTGTANYMAPELIKRQRTDQRIDIYSFSVTAYEMYARRLPWDVAAQETLETVLQHINKPPTPIKQLAPNIHPLVADTLMKGLFPNPDQRWQTIDEMLIPLRKAHEEIEAKRALERRKKAASAKVKSAGADAKAKAKKTADDDAFVDQILLGEAAGTGATKKGLKGQQGPQELPAVSAKPVKKSSPAPQRVIADDNADDDDDDDFDGIEIEIEGTKLEEIKVAKKAVKQSPESVKRVSPPDTDDDDDEFAGIEIEEEGELPVERPIELPVTPSSSGAGRKLAMLFDDDDGDDKVTSEKSDKQGSATQGPMPTTMTSRCCVCLTTTMTISMKTMTRLPVLKSKRTHRL